MNSLATRKAIAEAKREGYDLPHAKCFLYDPKSEDEGICSVSKSVVNKISCDNPKDCDRRRRFLQK